MNWLSQLAYVADNDDGILGFGAFLFLLLGGLLLVPAANLFCLPVILLVRWMRKPRLPRYSVGEFEEMRAERDHWRHLYNQKRDAWLVSKAPTPVQSSEPTPLQQCQEELLSKIEEAVRLRPWEFNWDWWNRSKNTSQGWMWRGLFIWDPREPEAIKMRGTMLPDEGEGFFPPLFTWNREQKTRLVGLMNELVIRRALLNLKELSNSHDGELA